MEHEKKSVNAASFWRQVSFDDGSKLDTVDKIEEILYGIIAVLTFTCTFSAAHAGHVQVDTMLRAAFGCNIAWGLIDALFLIFSIMMYRGRALRSFHNLRFLNNEQEASLQTRDFLPPLISSLMKEEHISFLKKEFKKLPEPPKRVSLNLDDLKAAGTVFLLVFIATFPLTIPFMFLDDAFVAHRISNGIAVLLLFITGFYLGKKTGLHSIATGLVVMLIGVLMIAVTILLGG